MGKFLLFPMVEGKMSVTIAERSGDEWISGAYLSLLWRRKLVIVATLLVTITVVAAGSIFTTPIYSASAMVRLASVSRVSDDWSVYNMDYADRLMNTYAKMATSTPFLMDAAAKLGRAEAPQVDVQLQANTELMKISVEDPDPVLAAEIANVVAEMVTDLSRDQATQIRQTAQAVFLEQLTQLDAELTEAELAYAVRSAAIPESSESPSPEKRALELKRLAYDELLAQYERSRIQEVLQVRTLSLVSPATVPTAPVKPDIAVNVALGLIVGIAGGLALAFVLESFDTTLRTSEEIEQVTTCQILGEVPTLSNSSAGQGIRPMNDDPVNVEAFRRLRTNFIGLGAPSQLKTAIITSPEPGEGKSTIAANLAVAIAQSGQTIALVDADMRLPVLHELFELPNIGLSSVLQEEMDLEGALQLSAVPGLTIMTSGTFSPKSTELLASTKMERVIEQLRDRFDMVLFDTPALLAVADTSVLAAMVDGAVLIVGKGQTRRESAGTGYRQLEKTGVPWIGLVVNRTSLDTSHYRYYHKPRRIDARPNRGAKNGHQ